jgi:hypothetical protein
MPIESKSDLETQLEDSVKRFKRVQEAAQANRSAASQPEPEVQPRNVTVQPGPLRGTGPGR